ncbi:hypothetical protein [Mesomycoplasma molare]|uniref:Substrate-specific component FolT of folate ECF transporter n=1 Tax=Mesomycoplasma molare TaxID=171288 RepID=A0ABY5TXE7_9BACT|nr:hypothetical protein [Mesomycoplasma molare]UWD34256.1 substrate-specific component FolT of folate ECF transporter [Mesomycoplasma molare]
MKKINAKTISFVAVFMSISTIMLLLGIRFFPLAILPNLRFSIIGLPIKITGFIFGPIIGFLTGFLSDLISFQFVPSTYSIYYTIALSITGFIPGVISWIFFNFIKVQLNDNYIQKKIKIKLEEYSLQLEKFILSLESLSATDNKRKKIDKKIKFISWKINRLNKETREKTLLTSMLIFCWIVIILVATIVCTIVFLSPDETFKNSKFIKNKISFLILMLSGNGTMLIFITVARFLKFFKEKERFVTMVPIIAFSAILEPVASVILSLGDVQSATFPTFEVALISHFLISPIKIWINLFVIYLTSLVILPIVKNKNKNHY